jgi:hypothetical protein
MEPCAPYLNLPEAKLLLDIIDERQSFSFENIEQEKFISLIKFHNIAPLVFYNLQKYSQNVPSGIYTLLKSNYLFNISLNLKFWKEFLEINKICKQNNIALVPLKGMDILLRFYPAFDLRSMADIDILIKEEQFTKVEKILTDLGYQKKLLGFKEEYWRKHQCHIAFHKGHTMVEVHWALDFKRTDRIILPRLWQRLQEKQAGNHKINIMSPEDSLFSFSLHLRRFGNILSLKQVLDVAKIIKEAQPFDWGYVLEEARAGKIEATLYFILLQVHLFTEINISFEFFRKLNLPRWQKTLIKKLIKHHTFQVRSSFKNNYLKAHFLLYDDIFEPMLYLINIPYEQFCRFYDFKPYSSQTNLLYRLRFIYMPILLLKNKFAAAISHFS